MVQSVGSFGVGGQGVRQPTLKNHGFECYFFMPPVLTPVENVRKSFLAKEILANADVLWLPVE